MKIIIIGAGIGGLATANLLASDGHEVHVYEKNDQLGGRSGTFTDRGFIFDTGPSWYLMPDVFERYFQLLDTSASQELELVKLSPAYKVYSGNQPPITITGNFLTDRQTFETIEPGAGNVLEAYIKQSKQTYQLALQYFLYNNFDSLRLFAQKDVLRHAHQFIKLSLTPLHQYVRSRFKSPQLQQLLEYPMVFLGSSPFTAPALYSLMSALDFDEGVYYPKGTMYSVVTALTRIGKKIGVQYHLNAPVNRIITEKARAAAIELDDSQQIAADIVISNADLHYTETHLLNSAAQSYPARYWHRQQASPSALLMYLGIDGKVPEFSHHTLLFSDDWRGNFRAIFHKKTLPKPASLYISKTSQTDATAPEGCENIFVLVPLPAGVSIKTAALELLADDYLAQIKSTTGVDLKSRTITRTIFGPDDFVSKYHAWQGSMLGPSHRLSQSAFFRTPNRSKRLENLYYVGGGTVPGVGVPMCLISAELVAQRIKKDYRL